MGAGAPADTAMASHRKRLGETLLSLRLINEKHLADALAIQKESPNSLGQILVAMGAISEDQLLNVLAAQHGVSPWRLDQHPPSSDSLVLIPRELCRRHQILPIRVQGDQLILGMRDPADIDAIDLARNISGRRIQPVLVDLTRLSAILDATMNVATINTDVDDLILKAVGEASGREYVQQKADLAERDTRPVIGLVNQILSEAIRTGASDIHIEPRSDKIEVRFRVDGHLRPVREMPASIFSMFLTRLKIMSEMDIVESRLPQDGRVTVEVDGRDVDLRVSTLPSQYGQRMVLRILDKSKSLKSLDQIGFFPDQLEQFKQIIGRPYGIFLVTGPTGSGKTTTLYAALQEMRDVTKNVLTCEDPIEYEIPGISQSQVNEKVGLTFASQLRAILRQDPDVILVGEIRDAETAETAIRAALTGHMVLSTLHCNDAPSAVPRLLDIGVEPFLLGATLCGIMSQRLVRTTCKRCHGKGCADCARSGFKGRQAVQEIMPINGAVAAAIARRAPMEELVESAFLAGYRPMSQQAERLIAEGITTREEAERNIYFDSVSDHLQLLKAA